MVDYWKRWTRDLPKWLLIRPSADKSAKNTPNLSAQIVCPSPKVWDFDEKRLHWASVASPCLR